MFVCRRLTPKSGSHCRHRGGRSTIHPLLVGPSERLAVHPPRRAIGRSKAIAWATRLPLWQPFGDVNAGWCNLAPQSPAGGRCCRNCQGRRILFRLMRQTRSAQQHITGSYNTISDNTGFNCIDCGRFLSQAMLDGCKTVVQLQLSSV